MKVLLLSPYPERLLPTFEKCGDEVSALSDPIDDEGAKGHDMIVSYGYRHILKGPILKRPIINLHMSYLPWNRGADPNFWSLFDDTPQGVTLHWIDKGIDTGDIIAQWMMVSADDETLVTSYARLCCLAVRLFEDKWPEIRTGNVTRCKQPDMGTFHASKDKDPFWKELSRGFETPVAEVRALGRRKRASPLKEASPKVGLCVADHTLDISQE